MTSKSLIDRVLLLAAAVCAAGLAWQLTILLTSKGRLQGPHAAEMATIAPSTAAPTPPPAARVVDAPQAPAAPAKPDAAVVRVVYPGIDAPKTTVKASDPPPPTASPGPGQATVTPPAPAAVPTSPPSPMVGAGTPSADHPAASSPAADPSATVQVAAAEDVAAPSPPSAAPAPPAPKPAAGHGININNASVDALNRLQGGGHIGQAIASHRPYRSVDDLVKRRVLRRDVFDRIRGQIAAE